MSNNRNELIVAAYQKAFALIDNNVCNDMEKQYEITKQSIIDNESLTNDEKSKVIKYLNKILDCDKILLNEGKKRICENCQEECLATLYCEYCIRNYLKENFSNWTSENNDIDNLIQKCQMESIAPNQTVEWIPYSNLQNINYFTKGGCSEIYTADWIGGQYYEWSSEQQQLERNGTFEVILKILENVKSANRSWFDEAKSHLTITSKWPNIVQCYGLTQDPSNGNYMLVLKKLDKNLRKYLQQNHNQLTWKDRIKITFDIIDALDSIRKENVIHRDLHSGNILYLEDYDCWYISDLGFCGPADKPLGSIYGNLPYIAPEVIVGKGYTSASDIYSIAMLMWEISSGEPPFANYENDYETDYEFVMDVVNGTRPKIISETPLKYKELMEQCWDANPEERPDIDTLLNEISEMNKSYYKQQTNNSTNLNYIQTNENSNVNIKNFNSKVYSFKELPEPRNATSKEEQKEIVSENKLEQDDLQISLENDKEKNESKRVHPNISDENESNLIVKSKKIKINNKDENEVYNDPNFHSED